MSAPIILAGPPLSVDDPGILEAGHFELITAVTATSLDTGKAYQAPILDLSLGLIEDYVQFSVAYPYVFNDPDGAGSDAGWGNPEIGAKWRALQTDQWQVALAPAYAFGITQELATQGIGHDTDIASLPVLVEYTLGERWRLNGSLAYLAVEGFDDEVSWGIAGAYSLNNRWEILAELSAASNSDFNDNVVTGRVGFDFSISDKLHLLVSAATGLREPREFERLHYDYYLGLQFFP